MLEAISWNQYFVCMGIAAAGWYGYAFLRYAGKSASSKASTFSSPDRTALFATVEEHTTDNDQISSESKDSESDLPGERPDLTLLTQTVTEAISTTISEGADEGVSDAELAAQLQVILSNYSLLQHTAHGIAVNDFILREGKAAGFHFTKEEVKAFWD